MISYDILAKQLVTPVELADRVKEDRMIQIYKAEIDNLKGRKDFSAQREKLALLVLQRKQLTFQIAHVVREINSYKPPPYDANLLRKWHGKIKRRTEAIRNQMCREYLLAKQPEWRAKWKAKGATLPDTPPPVPDQPTTERLTNESNEG